MHPCVQQLGCLTFYMTQKYFKNCQILFPRQMLLEASKGTEFANFQ